VSHDVARSEKENYAVETVRKCWGLRYDWLNYWSEAETEILIRFELAVEFEPAAVGTHGPDAVNLRSMNCPLRPK
jgi:hypothetical protein